MDNMMFSFEIKKNSLVVFYSDGDIYYTSSNSETIGNLMKAIEYNVEFDQNMEIISGIANINQINKWYQLDCI